MMLHYRLLAYVGSIILLYVVLVACDSNDSNESHQYKDYITFMTNKLQLVSQNEEVILNLMDYVDELQERINVVKKLSKYLRRPLQTARGREREFLSNPLNFYSLLRQTQSDWTQVLAFLEEPVGQEQINCMRNTHEMGPKSQNVRDAMTAIHRIKEVYQLKSYDLARGIMKGVQYNAKLSVLDCYEMAYMYYNGSQFKRAEEWLLTARELMYSSQSDLDSILGVNHSDISSLLARTFTAMGNFSLAHEVLLEDPQFSAAAEEWLNYFKANLPDKVENEQLVEFNEYWYKLCRSNHTITPSRLSCSYKTSPSPFLRLAPFKMEQLSLDPYVAVFHDVVYSSEIEELKRATRPILQRATVSSQGQRTYVSSARTVSGAWMPTQYLSIKDNELAERIRQRAKDMSGLVIENIIHQHIQLLNYGFGGHYVVHWDFLNYTDAFYDDRIATVLFYLNDVENGGATIFPYLNLVVQPERGKVLHWYSMGSGSFDYERRSLHGACPVIIGNKLAMTQWIHESDQMFIMPCLKPPKDRKYY